MNLYFWLWLSLSLLCSGLVFYAVFTGKAPSRVYTAERSRSPGMYWLTVLFLVVYAAFAISMFAAGVYHLYVHGDFR